MGGAEAVRAAVELHAELIKAETLAQELRMTDVSERQTVALGDGQQVAVDVKPLR